MKLAEAGKAHWSNLWASAEESTIFTSWEFHEEVDTAAKLLVGCHDQRPVIGAWINESPFPYAAYQGLLTSFGPLSLRKKLSLVSEFLDSIAQTFGNFSLSVDARSASGLAMQWFVRRPGRMIRLVPEFSVLVDISKYSSFDDWLKTLAADRTHDLNMHQREVITEKVSSVELVDLLGMTFERQGISLWPNIAPIMDRYVRFAAKHGRVNAIRSAGRLVGATLFLSDRKAGYYVIGANDPRYRKASASTLLVCDQVRHFWKRDVGLLDLLSGSDPKRGAFKASFGDKVNTCLRLSFI